MSHISEFERKIKNASVPELGKLLDQYPSGSPFWQSAYDQLQIKKLTEIPNPTPQPAANKPNRIHEIGVGTFIVVLGAAAIWIIAHYFGIQL